MKIKSKIIASSPGGTCKECSKKMKPFKTRRRRNQPKKKNEK